MAQTFGSQVFGPWYDIVGWVFGSAMFFYFAFSADRLPIQQKEKLPAFLLNKSLCVVVGMLMALMGVGKFMKWW